MASKTYKTRVLVLKKTSLAEKDLVLTMIDESGMLVKGVAKGARKPGGSLAARLELFSAADVLMAKGRSLDVVCEARLAGPVGTASLSFEQSACCAPIAELLYRVAQPDLVQPRLYDMSRSAFSHISSAGRPDCLALCSAALWKVMAQAGFRPSFTVCPVCGSSIDLESESDVRLSPIEGGLVCEMCPRPPDALVADAALVRWCEALIRSRFDEVMGFGLDPGTSFQVLQLARLWIRAHIGYDLKSLGFLLSCGFDFQEGGALT